MVIPRAVVAVMVGDDDEMVVDEEGDGWRVKLSERRANFAMVEDVDRSML